MKVTLVSMVFPHPRAGVWPGIERAAGELARALVKAEASVTVLTTYWNGGEDGDSWEGVKIRRVADSTRRWGKAGFLMSWNVRSFARAIHRHDDILAGSDAIHAFVGLTQPGRLRRLGVPLFASFPHRERPQRLADRLTLAGRFGIERRFLRLTEGVFAGSSTAREVLVQEYGLNAARVHVVPLAVDGARFRPPDAPRPADPARDRPSGIRLLYAGPLIRRKDIRTLVAALPALRERRIPFKLTLVGEGPEVPALRALADSLGVLDRVEFRGFVSEDRLVEAYRESDIFVFPSLLEGFGLVLVEAMACGLPVVTTGIPPMSEVVGGAGLLVAPSDPAAFGEALTRLSCEHDLRQSLGEEGRRRVDERYLWSRVARETLEHYRAAARRRPPGR